MTRLHVLLGAGGVGKTTLAAGYALSLAGAGRTVGLLGIDPARRLQTALGLSLDDEPRRVPDAGALFAAMLAPSQCLPRWAAAEGPALARNAFFAALAERLATANDVFAAIRMVEWIERQPELDDLVVDTAPGLNALEFLRRPEALSAFLEGPLVGWLRHLARTREQGFVGRRVTSALSRIAGTSFLFELADFVALAERMLETMMARLSRARAWIASADTELVLVAAVREDAAHVARAISSALRALSLAPSAVVINRALDPALSRELDALDPNAPVARLSRVELSRQARVLAELAPFSPILLPAVAGLEGDDRRAALRELGDRLRQLPGEAEGEEH